MAKERQWETVRSKAHAGTWLTSRVGNQMIRIFVWYDARKGAKVYRRKAGQWIEDLRPARARGLLTMTRAPKQAPEFVIQPPPPAPEYREGIVQSKGQWVPRPPEYTKRSSSVKIAVQRGQVGNRQRQGNQ